MESSSVAPADCPLKKMPSLETRFTKDNLPARRGLEPNMREIAIKPISFRPYAEDVCSLGELKDRSGFIRDAVHAALQSEGPSKA